VFYGKSILVSTLQISAFISSILLLGCASTSTKTQDTISYEVSDSKLSIAPQPSVLDWQRLKNGQGALKLLESNTNKPLFVVDSSEDYSKKVAELYNSYEFIVDPKLRNNKAKTLVAQLSDVQMYADQSAGYYSIKSVHSVELRNTTKDTLLFSDTCTIHHTESPANLTYYTQSYGNQISNSLLSHMDECVANLELKLKSDRKPRPKLTNVIVETNENIVTDSIPLNHNPPNEKRAQKISWIGTGVSWIISDNLSGQAYRAGVSSETYTNWINFESKNLTVTIEPAFTFSTILTSSMYGVTSVYAADVGVNTIFNLGNSSKNSSATGILASYRNNPIAIAFGNPSLGYSDLGLRHTWKSKKGRWRNMFVGAQLFWGYELNEG